MKKVLKYFLMAVLVSAIGLMADSCKKETLDPEEQKAKEEQEKAEKAEQFWDVVGQLVAASDIGQDYKGKTFEPVIGIADASDPQARIVKSNSAAAAAQSFADLVNVESINEGTSSYTWTKEEVGTLTYTKTDGTTSWAEVKVEIPSVPHLSKIIYRSVEQSGENGSFSYAAYYRFGDVVKRNNDDGKEEYWVCVRPAFGPEGKEDSHWMCVGALPKKNTWSYTASNNRTYVFPTDLKTSKEHMQNLAELLYALCYPTQWQENITYYSTEGLFGPGGLPIFHDFHKDNIKYNNANFWNNVASKWKENGIDFKVMGTTLDNIAREVSGPGIHFLYKGYSWWTGTSNYATVYQAKFVNGQEVHANMQTEKPYTDQKVQMIYSKQPEKDIKEFNVTDKKYVIYQDFFGESYPRYIVRYAKGSDLASDKKSPAVDKAIPGVEEVYRYYSDVLPVANVKEHTPEITTDKVVNDPQKQNFNVFSGTGHYTPGSIYKDENGKYWVVMNIAGQGQDLNLPSLEPCKECEAAPLAELISFQGLEANEAYATNLPNFGQAVRGATFIRHYAAKGRGAFVSNDETVVNDMTFAQRMTRHLRYNETIQLNLLDLLQVTKGWGDERNLTQMFSVAYYEPTEALASGAQHLFRFLYPISLNNECPPYFFWKHYPAKPDQVSTEYTDFSLVSITLQDIASAEKVAKYAPDFYAKQPLEHEQAGRSIRSQTDPAAKNPQPYFYGTSQWNDHTDMWNEPILFFRMDAVYDRGTEYATTTLGGHKLTLVAEMKDFTSEVAEDIKLDAYVYVYSSKHNNEQDWYDNTVKVDGDAYVIQNWKRAWNL